MSTKQENVNDEAKIKAEEEAEQKDKEEATKTEGVSLKVLVAFTDKYTKENYIVNDIINVSEERATELLADSRRLVEKTK